MDPSTVAPHPSALTLPYSEWLVASAIDKQPELAVLLKELCSVDLVVEKVFVLNASTGPYISTKGGSASIGLELVNIALSSTSKT